MLQSNSPLTADSRVFLIDGSAFIFRAFHALPPLSHSDGTPIGAVSGFCHMLFKLTEELKAGDRPTHFAVIFDAASRNFRHDIYPQYKANRPPAPPELVPQFSLCRDAVRAFGVASIEQQGFEADDLIATYAEHARQNKARTYIYSSDKDLMQLVDDYVCLVDPMKNKIIESAGVIEKFGVPPHLVRDVQALAGDSSDNIPGVAGIGIKTAAELITQFGSLEQLLASAHTIKQNKRRENLMASHDIARISYQLVDLKKDVPVHTDLETCAYAHADPQKLLDFLQKMQLKSLVKRVHACLGGNISSEHQSISYQAGNMPQQADLFATPVQNQTPKPHDFKAISLITCINDFDSFLQKATQSFKMTVHFDKILDSGLVLSAGDDLIYIATAQLQEDTYKNKLQDIFNNASVLKIGYHLKEVIRFYDLTINAQDDLLLMGFCLHAGKSKQDLAVRITEDTAITLPEIDSKKKFSTITDYLEERQEYLYLLIQGMNGLHDLYAQEIFTHHQQFFYQTIERPMTLVVAQMEKNGILVDTVQLNLLSQNFHQQAEQLQTQIFAMAGESFNIASPKQLSEILFEKLRLGGDKQKKTATGQMATGVDILEDLAASGHEIADLILKWRGLQKLTSTYTEALPEYINAQTRRIHTSFHLTGAATGRFSSSNPNVQNIPVKTTEGRLIRQAFIAPKDHVLVASDYSQVELRILAHIADVKMLKQAFLEGQDIHTRTASEIFHVPLQEVSNDLRRKAKAVNFGIIYGMSAFGLSRQLKISQSEAKTYIEAYFQHLPEIKTYMDETIGFAEKNGFVQTIYGRKIHVPEILSKNFNQKSFSQRAAINAPIQGTAADIMKLAMVDCDRLLQEKFPHVKMLLQIHDELVFEVPETEAESFIKHVTKTMRQAPIAYQEFSVPFEVQAAFGHNWQEAK